MKRLLLATLIFTLVGCGAKPGAADVATMIDGKAVTKLGFGAEGGQQPALVHRAAGGWALAYVGTRSGDRHVYVTTSPDGQRWGKARAVAAGEFSDQAPALAEDAQGHLHLYFASNRAGDDFALYHASEQGGAWGDAAEVPGFDGVQDLAVAAGEKGFTLVAEVMTVGLMAATSPDGTSFAKATQVAEAGAEPAAVALPDGRTLVAYQLEGKIMAKAGKPGAWGEAAVAATGASRLRDPGLAWAADHGELMYSERGGEGMALKAKRFDQGLAFTDATAPAVGAGDARGVAIAFDDNGSKSVAWGMKTTNGQQGVMVTR